MIKKGDRVRSRYNDRFGTVTSVEDWGSGSRYFVRFDKDNDSVEVSLRNLELIEPKIPLSILTEILDSSMELGFISNHARQRILELVMDKTK